MCGSVLAAAAIDMFGGMQTARALVRMLCDGMAHVHERGIMHRDLKVSYSLDDRVLMASFTACYSQRIWCIDHLATT